jgi:signal transduction histidine kinase
VALVSTAVVVTAAVGWAGWRLLDQERALDARRARDQTENAADAVAAGVRSKLADAGERLSGWVANPSSSGPLIEGAVVVTMRPEGVAVNPPGGLPYVPLVGNETPRGDPFASLEMIEFRGDPARALAGYRALVSDRDPDIRAGALMRLGRVQRKMGDLAGARETYQRLAELGPVRVSDAPAELAALSGLQSIYSAAVDERGVVDVSQRILRGLDTGRWLLPRGVAEFYREPFAEPRPPSWMLADALSDVWRDAGGRPPARGYRVFSAHDSRSSVLVVWRSNGTVTAALAGRADALLAVAAGMSAAWQLIDSEGVVISGRAGAVPSRSVTRIIEGYPWTLHTWVESPPTRIVSTNRTSLLVMMSATLAFVWVATYFMARAIRREAAVARLRSDFVGAVSHEFRSPLTAIRQMAEMLDADRVPNDDRRRQYYRVLAAEAARLQRLVETLLDFGRIEAGGTRYRFVDLDAVALVREVVDDVEPQARELGKTIDIDGPGDVIRVLADRGALSVVLRNLIDNAIKYSPGEPIVWVRWRRDDHHAAISVMDRGLGIPPLEQQNIFDKFVRGRAAIEANIKGTGVGLALVQQIVAAHSGQIRLESEPGQGSTFTLLLPTVS